MSQRNRRMGELYRMLGARRNPKTASGAFKPGTSKSAKRRRAANREVVHSANPGQTFLVGKTEYLVMQNGSFRRLSPK